MISGNPLDIPHGGLYAAQLPPEPTCPAQARSLTRSAMSALALPDDLIESGVLCASEMSTNAFRHGLLNSPDDLAVPPELWMWATTTPTPRLLIAVFDLRRDRWPQLAGGDLLDENGKGLEIIDMVSAAWGAHLSRSRLGAWLIPGKLAWFALPLPDAWPGTRRTTAPAYAARRFHAVLTARGIDGIIRNDRAGVSLLAIPGNLNLWVYPDRFTLDDPTGTSTTRPPEDLQDLAETIVARLEERTAKAV